MKHGLLLGAFAALALTANAAQAVEITVLPSLAPNALGNLADFQQWNANAQAALLAGQTSAGAPGSPGYFAATPDITYEQLIVTNYTSWDGEVGPTGAYAGQHGRRGHFAALIDGQGELISIDQLSFLGVSTDTYLGVPYNGLGFSRGAGGFDYNYRYVGVQFGGDGALGGGDDVFITGGPNSQRVNLIVASGPGNAWDASCGSPGFPDCANDAERQAVLDAVASYPGHPYQFSGTYTYGAASGTGTFNVGSVPEPGTWALLILGFGATGAALRRRRFAH